MSNCCGSEDPPLTTKVSALPTPEATEVSVYRIAQMDCPTEQRLITDRLGNMPGIGQLGFNLLERTLRIQHTPEALAPALEAIRSLGFTPVAVAAGAGEPEYAPSKGERWRLVAAGGLALAAELLHLASAPGWLVAAAAIAAATLPALAGTTTHTLDFTWDGLGDLDAEEELVFTYAAGIPIRRNTTTWTGETDTDHAAVREGCVAITPLHLDLTHHSQLELVRSWALALEQA